MYFKKVQVLPSNYCRTDRSSDFIILFLSFSIISLQSNICFSFVSFLPSSNNSVRTLHLSWLQMFSNFLTAVQDNRNNAICILTRSNCILTKKLLT